MKSARQKCKPRWQPDLFAEPPVGGESCHGSDRQPLSIPTVSMPTSEPESPHCPGVADSYPAVRRVFHCKREPSRVDVYIGRPGPWGNPWRISGEEAADHDDEGHGSRAEVIDRYRTWIDAQPHMQRLARRELAGKRLGCWCAPKPCHGDVLADLANDGGPTVDPVFVFGSNMAGRHGRGAAQFAAQWRGAEEGVGRSRTGNAYALPTRRMTVAGLETLPVDAIAENIREFLACASTHPEESFQVTRVGCGLAGLADDAILDGFRPALALPNVHLPAVWKQRLSSFPALESIRVIVAGSRSVSERLPENRAMIARHLDRILSDVLVRARDGVGAYPILVSGGAKGADALGEIYAMERLAHQPVPFMRFPAEWDRYGKSAGMIRNQQMAWAATHLVAFWDGESRGTRDMIRCAEEGGLRVRVVRARDTASC